MPDQTKNNEPRKDPKIEDLRTKDATTDEQDKVKGGVTPIRRDQKL